MKSRVHPKYKTKYHVGNWPAYDRALVQRGDVTLWLAPEAITTWAAAGGGKRGGQLQYSDLAIETALTLRLIFHLPLRQPEGFLTSIFWMLDLDLSAPDHTTLSRRGQHLDPTFRRAPAGAGTHLIVDSTGLSIVGEGEWAAVQHGGRGRRGWKKLHLGVDGSGVIIAHALTGANVDDATTGTDHCTAECGGLHAAKYGTRFEALEPVRQGVRDHFGTMAAGVASGLTMRHDHGSQYMSNDFHAELRFLGIVSSPAFVRQPEGNGCIERFFRTLKEQLLWVRHFTDVEDLQQALRTFKETYNQQWLIERLGFRAPAVVRRAFALTTAA